MQNHQDDPPLTLLSSLTIQVLVTGDLAYFAAILGKVNMAGGWCTWCGLSPKQWSPTDHGKGELWTLISLGMTAASFLLVTSNLVEQGCHGQTTLHLVAGQLLERLYLMEVVLKCLSKAVLISS
jgi:hypothetical protein